MMKVQSRVVIAALIISLSGCKFIMNISKDSLKIKLPTPVSAQPKDWMNLG